MIPPRIPRPLADAELLETWEAAHYLALRPRTLHEWIQRGGIRAIGAGRRRRIVAQSVRDYIKEGGMPADRASSITLPAGEASYFRWGKRGARPLPGNVLPLKPRR
jgi:excisionase family DNA binding protein